MYRCVRDRSLYLASTRYLDHDNAVDSTFLDLANGALQLGLRAEIFIRHLLSFLAIMTPDKPKSS